MSARRDPATSAAGWLVLGLIGLLVVGLILIAIAAGTALGLVASEIAKAFR